jgi:hypothetical protein
MFSFCSPYAPYSLACRPQCCRVSFIDAERIEHAVEVSSASLYEACVLALAEFRRTGLPFYS